MLIVTATAASGSSATGGPVKVIRPGGKHWHPSHNNDYHDPYCPSRKGSTAKIVDWMEKVTDNNFRPTRTHRIEVAIEKVSFIIKTLRVATWTSDELNRTREADELRTASLRCDGTLHNSVIIWVIRVSNDIYVRSDDGAEHSHRRGPLERQTGNPEQKCTCWRRACGRSYSWHGVDLCKIVRKKAPQIILKMTLQVSRP